MGREHERTHKNGEEREGEAGQGGRGERETREINKIEGDDGQECATNFSRPTEVMHWNFISIGLNGPISFWVLWLNCSSGIPSTC